MNNLANAFTGANLPGTFGSLLGYLAPMTPFLLLVLANSKTNLKKEYRSRQFAMPIVSLLYCAVLLICMVRITETIQGWLEYLPNLLYGIQNKLQGALGGNLGTLANSFGNLGTRLRNYLDGGKIFFLLYTIENTMFMAIHVAVKKPLVLFMKKLFAEDNPIYGFCAQIAYEPSAEEGIWCIKPHLGQMRTFLRTFYHGAIAVSLILSCISNWLFEQEYLNVPFSPVFGLILLGEVFFFLDGLTHDERQEDLYGEADEAEHVSNYSLLRPILRKLFGDKLDAENTTINNGTTALRTDEQILDEMEENEDDMVVAYSRFMRRMKNKGFTPDQNYLNSGLELMSGKSILFNNPFYYDLIPYAFYPMNRCILKGQHVLIVLGRHGIEDDIKEWCEKGLYAITNVPNMWNVGVLNRDESDTLNVGIITRSDVNNLSLHEKNEAFFRKVGFVVIIEPSRLLTTAQVGLNSLVRHCRKGNQKITYCSTDKNCDGLVDALSHVLMTSLTEVSATDHHKGTSSYMCWEADEDRLQHRMLPNLSRYLGIGTEMSFVALKNQVQGTEWYGGDAFPVVDMHWIAKQYYYDLLNYAQLPASQDVMDEMFRVSPNLWNAKTSKNLYMTVEDESSNLFEIKRLFSTRGTGQGFVNVVSSAYLLKDYMTANDGLFNADSKAIPYIVADYAHTMRNVVLRLCLRMCTGMVSEEEIKRELMLVDGDTEFVRQSLWHEICVCFEGRSRHEMNRINGETIVRKVGSKEECFTIDTLLVRRKFSLDTGVMQNMYYISDSRFKSGFMGDLQSATYVAEDENGEKQYLGTELYGQVFQKYLPGQFFTFNGKYYEMQRVTRDGQVLVRRAADHIEGRPGYRQVREYVLSNVRDSETMGDVKDINGMKVVTQYADVKVATPAYWQMKKHNDFAGGRKILINGIPERTYCNKQILKIEFPDETVTPEIINTLTVLFNEVFATLFAENQPFICALNANESKEPITYSLQGENGFAPDQNVIYIVEDSQLDIGLLVAVKRNLNRIFSIVCDYLDWHFDAMEKSMNPPAEPEAPKYPLPEPNPEEGEEEEPKGFFGRLKRKIRRIIQKIKDFFGKLFKKKTPEEKEKEKEEKKKRREEKKKAREEKKKGKKDNGTVSQPAPGEEGNTPDGNTEGGDMQSGMSVRYSSSSHGSHAPEALLNAEGSETEGSIEFETPEVVKPEATVQERKPYHERYFLLYGGTELPEILELQGTFDLLKGMGFDNSGLKQAREGKSIAEMIENSYEPRQPGKHYCDFCGAELTGKEMEVLKDGRERCMVCSRTAIKSEKEFISIYREVIRNMDLFYGVKIKVPVRVKMVNSKRLHKALNKTFVPTGEPDGRVLGVAIRKGDEYTILVENGAPRIQSIMTLAHETTHIWQYLNWNRSAIRKKYGKDKELEVYEGMAKWSEIQYAYLINEIIVAKKEEIVTRQRPDEYGVGFCRYVNKYPLSEGTELRGDTPFMNPDEPL